MKRWTSADSEELYNLPSWGLGYFGVNEAGNLTLRPQGKVDGEVDIKTLVDDIQRRGVQLPVLIRFTDVLKARIEALATAFHGALAEYDYQGRYRGVYPIKVNQQRHLVNDIIRFSRPFHLGLEAGSKPELLIVLALLDDPEALVICNGYKDTEYIEMALLSRKLGRKTIIVIEKIEELDIVLEVSKRLNIEPVIGVRAKLTSPGSGRWKGSSGDRAKFGLTTSEIVEVTRRLKAAGRLSILQLLHFHIGSQVSQIRSFRTALREATRLYTELHRLGAKMGYIDVGGGLGVDYDGSRTNFASSMNYDVKEYAHAVVSAVTEACAEAEVPHPDIITEAGRAMVAHSSMLVFPVLGVSKMAADLPPRPARGEGSHLEELFDVYDAISAKNLQEPYHDASEIKEQSLMKFNLGLTTIEERADIDKMFWAICWKIMKEAEDADYPPEEMEGIEKYLADTYFCNFSLFQSAPDSWAISQLFPIMPIQRLHTKPTRKAVLADITCDSDGKVDRFIDRRDVKNVLELHDLGSDSYYVGMFLLGAYQEILGDLHNLFGDTNAVHVTATPTGGYRLDHIVEGDTVREVLEYVQYPKRALLTELREAIEAATEEERLSMEEGAQLYDTYQRNLEGYTYLENKQTGATAEAVVVTPKLKVV